MNVDEAGTERPHDDLAREGHRAGRGALEIYSDEALSRLLFEDDMHTKRAWLARIGRRCASSRSTFCLRYPGRGRKRQSSDGNQRNVTAPLCAGSRTGGVLTSKQEGWSLLRRNSAGLGDELRVW